MIKLTHPLTRQLPARQRGIALVTILLVVVIATVLGVTMTTEQNFAINRARSFFDQTIVRQYTYGGEELARQILREDFNNAPDVDHLQENWASLDLKFDFEEGEVEILIEDLQGKININSITQDSSAGDLARKRFSNLLAEQGIDKTYVDRIIDWIDDNNSTMPLGAEDYAYLGLDRPYRTSGQLMVDVSELRLILELDNEKFTKLRPYLVALPDPSTPININTASAEVIQVVAPGLPLAAAEALTLQRDENQHYQDLAAFTGDSGLSNFSQGVIVEGLSVQSNFFKVSIRARYQDRFGYLTSIIQRNPTDGSMRVVYRDQSKKILPLVVEG